MFLWFAFILSSLFTNKDALFNKSPNVVATINGKDLTREGFTQKAEQLQRQMGPNATSSQVMNRLWDQEVRQAVMEAQFNELEISVEKDQMRDLLKTSLATNQNFLNHQSFHFLCNYQIPCINFLEYYLNLYLQL